MNILIVDSDTLTATSLKAELEKAGHHVTSCHNGTCALTSAIMHDYDLLFCELTLPDLPGSEFIRAIKAQAPHIPVIVISSLDKEEWAEESESAGATCFLQKPLNMEDVWQEIHFVQMGRAELKVGIIDPHPIHQARLAKTLEQLGCEVQAWNEVIPALKAMKQQILPSLLLIDISVEYGLEALQWAKGRKILVFVFADKIDAEAHDKLMRAGAALVLTKPINAEALVTQARFLAQG